MMTSLQTQTGTGRSSEFKRLRRAIAGETTSSDAAALLITAVEVAIYLSSLYGFCALPGIGRWFALAVASITAGALFLLGHDAAHRALAKTPWLNVIIGHIAFMPTLHPQIAWIIGHNRRHHGFTNLRGVDYVWTPWSAHEYLNASAVRRLLYRLYRTPLGIGLYYPVEIWWFHMWHRDALDRSSAGNERVTTDRCIALAGFLTIFTICAMTALAHGQTAVAAVGTAIAAVGVPLITYNVLMSIVIFIHHTHPTVRWFPSRETYDPLTAQMQDTVHVQFPKPIELLFHEIFQHTAHHMNPRVPLYRLARAQRKLEAAHGPPIVQEAFSFRYLVRLLRECQLYDYEAHQWLTIESVTGAAGASRVIIARSPAA